MSVCISCRCADSYYKKKAHEKNIATTSQLDTTPKSLPRITSRAQNDNTDKDCHPDEIYAEIDSSLKGNIEMDEIVDKVDAHRVLLDRIINQPVPFLCPRTPLGAFDFQKKLGNTLGAAKFNKKEKKPAEVEPKKAKFRFANMKFKLSSLFQNAAPAEGSINPPSCSPFFSSVSKQRNSLTDFNTTEEIDLSVVDMHESR